MAMVALQLNAIRGSRLVVVVAPQVPTVLQEPLANLDDQLRCGGGQAELERFAPRA